MPGRRPSALTPQELNALEKEDIMCYPVTCSVCGKITWDGCGEHVAEVKASVPDEQWCGGEHPAPAQ